MEYSINDQQKENEELILWIEEGYKNGELSKQAKNLIKRSNRSDDQSSVTRKSLFQYLRAYLIANPTEYYGKSIVSDDLVKNAKITARTVTVSNIINFAFTVPLLYYAYSFLGGPIAYLASLASGLGIQAFSNANAAAVAGRKSNNQVLPQIATIGMILINLILTVGSGIGGELLTNQSKLAELVAISEVNKLEENLVEKTTKENSQYYPLWKELDDECKLEFAKRSKYEEGGSDASRVFWEYYGMSHRDYIEWKNSVDFSKINNPENFGICPRRDIYKYRLEKDLINAKQTVQEFRDNRTTLGNDVQFLKNDYKNIYNQYFDNNNYLENGTIAVQKALDNLYSKFKIGQWNKLGFSIFLMSISLVTSSIACFLTLGLSEQIESEKAHSDAARAELDKWLKEQWSILSQRHQQQEQELRKILQEQIDGKYN